MFEKVLKRGVEGEIDPVSAREWLEQILPNYMERKVPRAGDPRRKFVEREMNLTPSWWPYDRATRVRLRVELHDCVREILPRGSKLTVDECAEARGIELRVPRAAALTDEEVEVLRARIECEIEKIVAKYRPSGLGAGDALVG